MKIIIYLVILTFSFSQNLKIDMAVILMKNKKESEALNAFENILKSDSNNINALLYSSEILCNIGYANIEKDAQEKHYRMAIYYAEKATNLKPDSDACHIALSRSYGRLAQILSISEQLKLSKKVKSEADIAISLNPKSDIAWHIIGKWHFRISELSWFEKAIANTIFGEIPKEASFENALKAFIEAQKLKPKSIAHNVELAKTYIKLHDEKTAKDILLKVINFPLKESNDFLYLEEAKKISLF